MIFGFGEQRRNEKLFKLTNYLNNRWKQDMSRKTLLKAVPITTSEVTKI